MCGRGGVAHGALSVTGVGCALRALSRPLEGSGPVEKVYGPAPRSRRAVRVIRLAGCTGGCHPQKIFFGFFFGDPVFRW